MAAMWKLFIFISWVKVFQGRCVVRIRFFTLTRSSDWWIFSPTWLVRTMLHSWPIENFSVAVTWPGICRVGIFCHQRNWSRELAKALFGSSTYHLWLRRGSWWSSQVCRERWWTKGSPLDKTTCHSDNYLCDERLKNHCSAIIFNWYKVWQKKFILVNGYLSQVVELTL